MTPVLPNDQTCAGALRQLDLYLDHQLALPDRQRLQQHLDACPACALELEARTRVRGRLRTTVKGKAAAPFLATRVLANIREYESKKNSWLQKKTLAPVAAALLVCFSSIAAYHLGQLWLTHTSQEAFFDSISHGVSHIMQVGLGDHVHCAVYRKFPKDAPSLSELGEKLTAEHTPLIQTVSKHVPSEFKVVLAHQCSYRGRRFVHLALKSDSKLLSLLITKRNEGETFSANGLLPALISGGIPVYRSTAERFEIAGFETRDHLAFVVSDLPQHRNLEVMTGLAPQINEHLRKLEI
jgi:anti-sigma factor (TIGR02949 family)